MPDPQRPRLLIDALRDRLSQVYQGPSQESQELPTWQGDPVGFGMQKTKEFIQGLMAGPDWEGQAGPTARNAGALLAAVPFGATVPLWGKTGALKELPRAARAPYKLVDELRALMSTRVPTGLKAGFETEPLQTGVAEMMQSPKAVKTIADAIRNEPILTKAEQGLSDEGVVKAFRDSAAQNMHWLIGQMAPYAERSRQWYDGAQKVSQLLSKTHGISQNQSSGMIAVLSSQKDWHQNAEMARRVMSGVRELDAANPTWTSELWGHYAPSRLESLERAIADQVREGTVTVEQGNRARAILPRELERERVASQGLHWQDMSEEQQAKFLRAWDEKTNGVNYPILNPEGTVAHQVALTSKGQPGRMTWQKYPEIQKAIRIMRNNDLDVINEALGDEHKVRSFFNNINVPEHPGSVTVDTHQVAAGNLQPMGAKAPEVKLAMGAKGASAATGVSGTNPIYRDATTIAAQQAGMLPREGQSVSWEGLKGLFTPAQKRNQAFVGKIRGLWEDYSQGRLSREAVYDAIRNEAGGVKPPAWATGAAASAPE